MNHTELAINGRFLSQPITGVQRVARELSTRLTDRITGSRLYQPSMVSVCDTSETVSTSQISSSPVTSHIWEQTTLPWTLRGRGSPLLMNFTGVGPVGYKRKVCFAFDASLFRHPEWFSRSYRTFYRVAMPYSFANAQKIATISEFSRGEIIEALKIDPLKVFVVSPAAATLFFERKETRLETSPYILAVGSMDPRKNLKRLIKATEPLRKSGVKLKLVGNAHPAFREFIDTIDTSSEGVELLSNVDDLRLRELYRNASCLAFPSLYEGFGLPLVEAMAAGCPVVCSQTTSLPEIAGEAAIYVDPLSEQSILEGISRVVHSSEEGHRLRDLGFLRARMFSWDSSADVLANELQNLL